MNLNKVFLFRQNANSQGAKILARTLGIKMIKPEGSRFSPSPDKVLINWGSGAAFPFETGDTRILNPPSKVDKVTNKHTFFEMCKEDGGVSIPGFTARKEEARDWLREGHTVFARTTLRGSAGAGIVEVSSEQDLDPLANGTLLVKYIQKKHEFRIHIGGGNVIDAIAFNQAGTVYRDVVQLAYRLDVNEYRGRQTAQLIVEQIAALQAGSA